MSKCPPNVQKRKTYTIEMNIYTMNPGNLDDKMIRSKTDLKGLFCMHIIKAERSLDESDSATDNPIGQIMKKLFNSEIIEFRLIWILLYLPWHRSVIQMEKI